MEPSPPSAHLEQRMAQATVLNPPNSYIVATANEIQSVPLFLIHPLSGLVFSPCCSGKAFLKLFQRLLWLHFFTDWWLPAAVLEQCPRLSVPRNDNGSPACGLQVSSPTQGRWNSRDSSQHWVHGGSNFSWERRAPLWLFYMHLKVHPVPHFTNPPLVSLSRGVLTENREWN